jgi:hypothetical protein
MLRCGRSEEVAKKNISPGALSAAKAVIGEKVGLIAAVNRCATHNQDQNRFFRELRSRDLPGLSRRV